METGRTDINRSAVEGIIKRREPIINGAGDRSRTYDLLITNQLLYQLSYASTGGDRLDCLSRFGYRFSGIAAPWSAR